MSQHRVKWIIIGFNKATERELESFDLPAQLDEAALKALFKLPADDDLLGSFPITDAEVIARVEKLIGKRLNLAEADYFFEGQAVTTR